jgi:hypothetical protein
MSTQIKRIEKEYFLSKLVGEQIPVMYIYNRNDYVLKVDRLGKEEIDFVTVEPVEGLLPNKRISLMFNYKGLIVSFSVEVKYIGELVITTTLPEVLYKNLDRSNSRVAVPADLQIELTFLEDRYSLPFPKTQRFEAIDESVLLPNMKAQDFNAIVNQMAAVINRCADGYKLVYFNTKVTPESQEERIISENGKILFIPSSDGKLPQADAQKLFVTEDNFKRYLETIGIGTAFLDQTVEQFFSKKKAEDIASVAWIPFLFHEYVVGYIYVWRKLPNTEGAKPCQLPFDEKFVETLYGYGKCLSFSLKERGYFEAGRMKNRIINGKVVDISASGMRFAVLNSFVFFILQPGLELGVKFSTADRTIRAKVKVRRRYKEGQFVYLGSSFLDMTPDDAQYLFEAIYGKPSFDSAESLLSGNV